MAGKGASPREKTMRMTVRSLDMGQELLEDGVRPLPPMCERMTSQRQIIYVQYADRRRGSQVKRTHPRCPLVS
jgi:hypothetical protein